jgi:hypothetical protein
MQDVKNKETETERAMRFRFEATVYGFSARKFTSFEAAEEYVNLHRHTDHFEIGVENYKFNPNILLIETEYYWQGTAVAKIIETMRR